MTNTDTNERLAYSVDKAAAITGLSRRACPEWAGAPSGSVCGPQAGLAARSLGVVLACCLGSGPVAVLAFSVRAGDR